MGTNMARCASWATGLFNKARSAALNRPVAKLAMSAIFRAHCVNEIIDYSFYITPRILMAKFKMIVIPVQKCFKTYTKVCPIRILSAKIQTSAWQCSALCKAQVKAYLSIGVFRVTVNSPSVTRIHLLAIFYFEVFIYSAAEECYTVQFLQLMLTITCTHMIACA